MPFKSKSQARWMFLNEPEMAKKWARHTKDMKKLPDKKEGTLPSLGEIFSISEDLDVKKLHDESDFTEEAKEFIKETNAQLKMLLHFVSDKNLGKMKAALEGCQKSMSNLEREVSAAEQTVSIRQGVGQPTGKAFKK